MTPQHSSNRSGLSFSFSLVCAVRTTSRHAAVLGLMATLLVLLDAQIAAAEPVAWTNATVLTMTGDDPTDLTPIEGATIITRDGRITAVGADVSIPADVDVRVDLEGALVTPGLIDIATGVGLVEIWAVGATRDRRASEPLRPAFKASDAFNPESEIVATTRREGVTSVGVLPRGGLIAGRAAHCDLAAENSLAEACDADDVLLSVNMGERGAGSIGGSRAEAALRLRETVDDARYFAENQEAFDANQARDLTLSRLDLLALQDVVAGELPVAVLAHRASDIDFALEWTEELGAPMILVGGAGAWKRADALAARGIPVVVDPMMNAPERFESLDARPDNAALLHDAGVPVVISTFDTHNVRNLRQAAGNAVRAGLPWGAAMAAITARPADALGLDGEVGRIASGLRANFVVWSGDPFEGATHAQRVVIDGVEQSLESRQSELFERYSAPMTSASEGAE